MSDRKTFAGIPVDGYGSSPHHHNKPQRPKEDLEPLFTAALAHPEVKAIRWDQYTPYFNDGEPCYFSVHDPVFLLDVSDDDDGDYEDGYLDTYDKKVAGGRPQMWDYQTRAYRDTSDVDYPLHPAYDDLRAITQLCNGEFDDALVDLFGDHVRVTVTRDKIEVDDYEHE